MECYIILSLHNYPSLVQQCTCNTIKPMIDIPCCSVHTSICKLLWMCIEFTMNKDEYCNQLFVTSFWLHGESCVYLVAYIVTPNQCVQLLSDYITHFNVLRFCVSASLCVCVYLCMHVCTYIYIYIYIKTHRDTMAKMCGQCVHQYTFCRLPIIKFKNTLLGDAIVPFLLDLIV